MLKVFRALFILPLITTGSQCQGGLAHRSDSPSIGGIIFLSFAAEELQREQSNQLKLRLQQGKSI